MGKGLKKPIKVRKRWAINPKTKVEKSRTIYYRPVEKRRVKKDEA